MTDQVTSTGRTFSTSIIQREVIQAQGHRGSNQNSAALRSDMGDILPSCRLTSRSTGPRDRMVRRPQRRPTGAHTAPHRPARRTRARHEPHPRGGRHPRSPRHRRPPRRRARRRPRPRDLLDPKHDPLRLRASPAARPSSTSSAAPSRRSPSTAPTSTRPTSTPTAGCACPGWPPRTSWSSPPPAATPTPARACTASSTRSTTRSTSTASSRCPTAAGCSPSSSSPTSRPASRSP